MSSGEDSENVTTSLKELAEKEPILAVKLEEKGSLALRLLCPYASANKATTVDLIDYKRLNVENWFLGTDLKSYPYRYI